MRRTSYYLMLASVVTFVSCADVRTVLHVAPERVPCIGVGPRECLLVREGAEGDWEYFYDAIQGFEFEPGFHYVLLVRKERVSRPAADASSLRWKLIRVLDKEPAVDTTNTQIASAHRRTGWAQREHRACGDTRSG